MPYKRITDLLDMLTDAYPPFPPTELYCEGWLLRLVVDWFATHEVKDHPLAFISGARWFSEARLPSAFLARFRGDPQAETHTNADGVIGHIDIGISTKAGLELRTDATQFLVLEAKINAPLSSGTTRAPYYDQAARNVACIADVLRRAERSPDTLEQLGFFVVAPEAQIQKGTFTNKITRESIQEKVQRRVSAYEDETMNQWFETWFLPLLKCIDIQAMSWESLIGFITEQDEESGKQIEAFYTLCLKFN